MAAAEIITAVAGAAKEIITSEKVQEMVLGKYDDGSIRSIPDAIHGVVESPNKRSKENHKKKKKKKKLKKAAERFDIL